MGLCGMLFMGLIVGLIARALMPGDQNMGLLMTSALGIGGSFVGGALTNFIHGGSLLVSQPVGFVGALIGSMVLLLVAKFLRSKN